MRTASLILLLALLVGAPLLAAPDQGNGHGGAIVPDSSLESPFDIGVSSHTNHLIHIKPAAAAGTIPYIPSDLQSAYGITPGGGSGAIAVVLAFHNPYALSDFNQFSAAYGLPTEPSTSATASTNAVFQIVYANGSRPRTNSGWSQESSLDIEWSHAMAPKAKIYLVEARSNFNSDLLKAVSVASGLPNVTQVSMSWGGGEWSTEASNDPYFTKSGISFFAASGDTGGQIIWPSVSANVVAAGGTSLTMSGSTVTGETGWSGSGGGNSKYVGKPAYQLGVGGSNRSVPDLSSDADPNTGVLVIWNGNGYQFGGTSVSSPCLAGMANRCGVNSSSATFLSGLYTRYRNNLDAAGVPLTTYPYRDITSGSAGSNSAGTGFDYVTGVGAPTGSGSFGP